MPRYLVLWKSVNARVPENPEARLKQFTTLTQMIHEDVTSGRVKDWGIFAEGGGGYAIFEGSELDLSLETAKYVPYVELEARTVLSTDQQREVLGKLAASAPK